MDNYNTLVTLTVAVFLAASGGLLGTFVALRGRTLVSDAICHATLPGIALAFLLGFALTGNGVGGGWLALGGIITAAAAARLAFWIPTRSKLGGDAATGCTLALFFSAAVVLLSVIQNLPASGQAGLSRFLIGNAAAVTYQDAVLTLAVAALTAIGCVAFFKELAALCFDEEFFALTVSDRRRGNSRAELTLLGLVTLFAVAGIQIVGVVFTVGLLIAPFAAMRLWFDDLKHLCIAAALSGAAAAAIGTFVSLGGSNRPTGTLIILSGVGIFIVAVAVRKAKDVLSP